MRSPSLRVALLVLGAGLLVAIPTALVLGSRASTSANNSASITPRPSAVAPGRDDDDRKAQLANRTVLTTSAPSAAATVAATVRASASSKAAPTPAPSVVPAFSHVFVIVLGNHEYGSGHGSAVAP